MLWDENARRVTVIQPGKWLDLWPGYGEMVINGRAIPLEVAPQAIQGRTMIPLRAVAEAFDLTVEWDPATKGITLR